MRIDQKPTRLGSRVAGDPSASRSPLYVPYALGAPQGPRGGSAIGLLFGIVGFAFMLFAALLGARKRVPVWRLGRAQAWMRGHLWLGVLSSAADSAPRRIPLRRHTDARADVAADHHRWQRRLRRRAATLSAAHHDHRRSAGNDLRRNLQRAERCCAKKPIATSKRSAARSACRNSTREKPSAPEALPRCVP